MSGRTIKIGGVNHSFHLIMTLCTCGMWLPVWILAWIICRPKRINL